MTAQGYNVELREYPVGWRANFYWTGTAHSVVVGSAWCSVADTESIEAGSPTRLRPALTAT